RAAETAVGTGTGPWAINLMSSVDRDYVANAATKARNRGIQAELNSADVGGKQYWRLQVTGFKSLVAARSRAAEIKQILGIDEVWFHKRKAN
ncbi:MAG: SPOR domain-containing protein, partial [Thiohalobacterales bacterium]|nr:SPOR domain-containing protein [Thiohalobacterales bacterium]